MNLAQTMVALRRAGTEANRKVLARHGAQAPMFGVSYATLYALQKRIGVDQRLAEALWNSGNHDARVLATLVADGGAMTAVKLNGWRRAANHRLLAMAFSSLAVRSRSGLACALRWIDGKAEFEQAAGWGTLAGLANARSVPDDVFAVLLPRITKTIHGLRNQARHSANNCLIAIGGRPSLHAAALQAARVIGSVAVDHGDTDCKTPQATSYMAKVAKRRAAKGKAPKKRSPPRRAKTRVKRAVRRRR